MAENGSFTILAVDDNDALRYSLSRTLQGGGYKVLEARNGSEALRLAEVSPDLITLDVNLPDMDGFEVCRRLKTNPRTSHIPVLHISATCTETEFRLRGLEAADGYLTEPISREELLASVNALLRLKQAEREARLQAAEAEKARREVEQAHNELEMRVEQRTKELSDKAEEVRQLNIKLLRLQDEERRRIARELHDSTGQNLAAMKMILDQMAPESKGSKLGTMVDELTTLNNDMIRQLRTMSYLLHPPLLDEVGLPSALKWYVEGFEERSGIKVELDLGPDFGRLSHDMETALFRVAQESLTNIHKHSGSATAQIRLSRDAEGVVLAIADHGTGIPSTRLRDGIFVPGVGLMGIRERVQQFGGNAEIVSSAAGTTVTAAIPLGL
ncbi:MAG: response regulator [Candidatus Sulfotelmatobacter sp.]